MKFSVPFGGIVMDLLFTQFNSSSDIAMLRLMQSLDICMHILCDTSAFMISHRPTKCQCGFCRCHPH